MNLVDKPYRWPLAVQAANRSSDWTKDARLVNAYAERDPNTDDWRVEKRIGFVQNIVLGAGLLGRGLYTWYQTAGPTAQPSLWTVLGNGANASLYKNGALQGVALSLTDAPGNWAWTETQSATRYLVFAGTDSGIYYSTGAAATKAAAPAGAGSYVLGLAFLDGTVYFMDELCQIFGSNLNNPTVWQSTNVITAQKVPGTGVALTRQLSYIIALKTSSMEVFYDGGNATGSPLLQIDGATNNFGCGDRDTVQVLDDILLYLSTNQTGSPQIIRVDSLTPSVVSTPAIERLIALWQPGGNTYSWVFKLAGHRYYGISNDLLNLTLVYDLDQKLWYQWTDADGNWMKSAAMAIDANFVHQLLHPSNGTLYTFDSSYSYPTDNGAVAPVDIYTPSTDFGTRRRKVLHRMYLQADQMPGSLLYIRRSDDDFQTWSNFRKIDLGKADPFINNEGRFVRRAYHFRHSAPVALRITSADLQMSFGSI